MFLLASMEHGVGKSFRVCLEASFLESFLSSGERDVMI